MFALLVLVLLSDAVGVQSQASLRIIDDAGQEVRAPIRICLYNGDLTECLDQAPYRVPLTLVGFTSATAEGPSHGPVAVDRTALEQDRHGQYLLRVPRKAGVTLRTAQGPPVAISLFRVDDPSFRKPFVSFSSVGPEGVLAPAGQSLLVIADGAHAPAVFASILKPGSRNTFSYPRSPGWSAVLRCQSATALRPACSARALSASRPASQRELAHASADRHGLVIFNGLTEPFISLAISAPGFVTQLVRGVATRPGNFSFTEAALARGGAARALVTLDDRPLRRARCWLLELHDDVGVPTEETLYDGETTAAGICQTARAAAGVYVLRVSPTTSGQPAEETVSLTEGEITDVEVRLRSLPVTGRVFRGTRPERGAVVRIVRRDDRERNSSTYLELITDDEGSYHGVVWSTGEYSFVSMNAARSAVGTVRRATVGEDGAEVDLQLKPYEITGHVQDDERRRVPEATVVLTRNERSHKATKTATDGTFAFPIDGDGAIQMTSQKMGYQSAQRVDFTLAGDAEPPPVVLTMKKLPSIKGTLFWPSGTRAPSIGVASFQFAPGQGPMLLGAQRTDSDGAFELPRSSGGITQLFATGQGCPLLISIAPPEIDEVTLRCSAQSAGVQLVLRDSSGAPRSHESIILTWEGTLIPRNVLRDHVLMLGLPTETDGAGRLTLVGLPPGMYDIFLARGASEETITAGMPHGHLTTVQLSAFDRPEIEVTIQ